VTLTIVEFETPISFLFEIDFGLQNLMSSHAVQ